MASRKPIDSPGVAIPPLRPEAPKATVSRSKTATVAPLRARCRAADRPVSPAPTTATSTLPPTSVLDRSGPSGAVSSQYGLNFIGDLSCWSWTRLDPWLLWLLRVRDRAGARRWTGSPAGTGAPALTADRGR